MLIFLVLVLEKNIIHVDTGGKRWWCYYPNNKPVSHEHFVNEELGKENYCKSRGLYYYDEPSSPPPSVYTYTLNDVGKIASGQSEGISSACPGCQDRIDAIKVVAAGKVKPVNLEEYCKKKKY